MTPPLASQTFHDIEVGVVGSLVASAVTYVAVVIFRFRLPTLSHLIFWRGFAKDLVVVISEVPVQYDPATRRGDDPPLTPLDDAIMLGEFLRFFRRRLKADPLVVSAASPALFDQIRHHNLLIIGGPKYNFAAHSVLTELDSRLPYQFRRLRPREQQPYPVHDSEMKRFVGRTPEDAFVAEPDRDRDYGCVVATTNPYNEARSVVVVAGLSTLSTLGAGTWLQKRHPGLWLKGRFRHDGFQAIVGCRNTATTRVSYLKSVFVGLLDNEVGDE
jgi:hypothetical protein